MILTLNLNASLDKIYTVDKLEYGGVVRAKIVQNTAGGKGLHVANICKELNENYFDELREIHMKAFSNYYN